MDHSGFGRAGWCCDAREFVDLGELFDVGGRITGEQPISWIGDSEREVEEVKEDEEADAVAEHGDGGLMSLWRFCGSIGWKS